MKFWRKKIKREQHWTDTLPPGFLEEGDRLARDAWAALNGGKERPEIVEDERPSA